MLFSCKGLAHDKKYFPASFPSKLVFCIVDSPNLKVMVEKYSQKKYYFIALAGSIYRDLILHWARDESPETMALLMTLSSKQSPLQMWLPEPLSWNTWWRPIQDLRCRSATCTSVVCGRMQFKTKGLHFSPVIIPEGQLEQQNKAEVHLQLKNWHLFEHELSWVRYHF